MGNMYKNGYIYIFLNRQRNTCWKNFKWALQSNLGCVIKIHCGDVHRQNEKNGAIIQILMSLTVWFLHLMVVRKHTVHRVAPIVINPLHLTSNSHTQLIPFNKSPEAIFCWAFCRTYEKSQYPLCSGLGFCVFVTSNMKCTFFCAASVRNDSTCFLTLH